MFLNANLTIFSGFFSRFRLRIFLDRSQGLKTLFQKTNNFKISNFKNRFFNFQEIDYTFFQKFQTNDFSIFKKSIFQFSRNFKKSIFLIFSYFGKFYTVVRRPILRPIFWLDPLSGWTLGDSV